MVFAELIVGLVILAFFIAFDRNTVRVQWNSVASFMGFMSLLTCIRLGVFSFLGQQGFAPPQVPIEILQTGVWWFSLVFWEDAFYVLPIFLAHKYLRPLFAWIITIFLSVYFGAGHVYQGLLVAGITMLYPYFLSYKFGKKYGFGTVMVCHILYDYVTFFTVWLAPILIP
jgi:hypothetical protein